LWITGTFKTSSLLGVKAIASLIPINLYLQKLGGRSQLRAYLLLFNHILQSLMSPSPESLPYQHALSLNSLTRKQCTLIKGHIVDMENHFNKVFPSFDPLNPELFPGNRIIDTFTNCFYFHLFDKCTSPNIKSHIQQLDNVALESLDSPSSTLVVIDASIKNNITTSIVHVHVCNKPITKTLHHALNVMSTEAELFAIRYSINQATINSEISKIIVVMDAIHVAKRIFNLSSYPFQKQLVSILKDL